MIPSLFAPHPCSFARSGNPVAGTTAIIEGLTDNTAYEFKVRAVNVAGESSWSSTVTVMTDRILIPPVIPSGLKSTDKSTNTVSLEWSTADNAVSYEIQYRTGSGEWTSVPVSGISKMITGLAVGTQYQFQVQAVNADGKSGWSNSVFVTTDTITLTAPTNVIMNGRSSTTLSIGWTTVSGATGYEVQWALTEQDFVVGNFKSGHSTTAAYEIASLTAYTECWIRIIATSNTIGYEDSAPSAPVKFRTSMPSDIPLPDVSAPTEQGHTDKTLTISWASVPNAEGYTIQWSSTEDFSIILGTGHSKTTTYKITGLSACTEYWVRITATTTADGYQNSSASPSAKFETAEPLPAFNPTATADSGSVTISWTEGTLPAGSIFQFKATTSSEWITWITSTVPTVNMVIAGLKADTAYEFRLQDANGDQIGDVIQKTTEGTTGTPVANPVKSKASVVKKGDAKPTINSVTLTWDALPKKATAESNVVYIITCITPNAGITPVAVSGTGKLSHTFTGLKAGTTYKFTITAVNADGIAVDAKNKPTAVTVTAKTIKYVAPKTKADTKGTIVTGGDAKGKTATTIDSVTLTWATAGRPVGEQLVIKVIDAKTKQEIILTEANLTYSTGTDKKNAELTILTITGLKASTKYTVEVQAYTGTSLEEAIHKTDKVAKVSITTAKYTAVSKIVPTLSGDSVALTWQVPTGTKVTPGAVYTAYEIDYAVNKTERKSVAIASVAEDGKGATILLDTLTTLGIDMTETKKHNFVIRAVIYGEDGTTIINQSLDGKFALTPSKLV